MRMRWMMALCALGYSITPSYAERPAKTDSALDTSETPVVSPIVRVRATQALPAASATPATAVKSYAVADLIVPVPSFKPTGPANAVLPEAVPTLEKELIRNIQQAVLPKEWACNGGPATIAYHPKGCTLVVSASDAVHAKLATFLESTRKALDTQIMLEVRVVTLSDALYSELEMGKVFALARGEKSAKPKFITTEAVAKFMERVQADRESSVLSAPRMTMLNGQDGTVQIQESEFFLTGVNVKTVGGQLLFEPKNEAIFTGLQAQFKPQIERDAVQLETKFEVRQLEERPVPMTTITTMIRPVEDGGKKGPLVPFTQYVQHPKVIARAVNETCAIPSGRTAMFYAGEATLKHANLQEAPLLAKIPVIAQLFQKERKDHLVVLVTPKVITPEGDAEESEVKPDRLTVLLKAYQEACVAGNTDEARRLAIECLTLDPKCFKK